VATEESDKNSKQKFFVELIKPSSYDDDGYVIQWWKAFSISNSLACLHGLSIDCAERQILGDAVKIVVTAHDEHHTVIPFKRIIRRIQRGGRGIVCAAGVQTHEYPRAVDIGRAFREADIPVVIGGFHVSGTLAMVPELPADLQEALDLGITLFAGEAEGRLEGLFQDAYARTLKPIYNYLGELPDLAGQPIPSLPAPLIEKALSSDITLDTSRGCPFDCSFCTVINVQGKASRCRSADDVEKMIRTYSTRVRRSPWYTFRKEEKKRKNHFFFTDDNFARNRNWEAIFDRLITIREKEGYRLKFTMQIDVQAYKVPRFVDKAARAGCNMVFIGMESMNPDNLAAAHKPQNKIGEYREMLQAWRDKGIVTMAGYILGLPFDTPASIERDIKTIQDELPLDVIMFFALTPLPGSRDHLELLNQGAWMDPDLNKYDSTHVALDHPRMTRSEWTDIFRRAWDLYYSDAHVEKLFRRSLADRIGPNRLLWRLILGRCAMQCEHLHPFQYGAVRRKVRTQRRWGMPRENPFSFYPRRVWDCVRKGAPVMLYAAKLSLLIRRIKREVDF